VTDRWRLGANLATLANGLLGAGAIVYTLAGNKLWAMFLIVAAIGFDGLDGLLSRRSPLPSGRFGRIADSIADAVTFGLAPAFLIAVHTSNVGAWRPYESAAAGLAIAYAAAAGARLVYFTVRAHHLPHFLGVPTPQSALALVVALLFHDTPAFQGVQPIGVLTGVAILAALMVVPIPYPKIRRGAPLRWPMTVTAGFAAVALVLLQFSAARTGALFTVAEVAAYGLLVGVASYYLLGPFTTRPATPVAP
jgi:CDP-diacylglycerol---serine O-phosphatidyltransferase